MFVPTRRTLLALFLFAGMSSLATGQQLLVQYTFDDPGPGALDTGTGTPANGTLGNTAARTTNTPGGGAGFALDLSASGVASTLDGGDPAKVDTLSQFTLTTWLNLQGLNADQGGSSNVRLLAKQGPNPFNGFSWNLNNPLSGERSTGNFTLGLFIGGLNGFSFVQASEDTGADDQWTFLAVTFDGTSSLDNVSFYHGDETSAVSQLGLTGSAIDGAVASTTGVANFGVGFTDAAPTIDFSADGYQDDVRVYDGVLSPQQLEALRMENLGGSIDANFDGLNGVDGADLAVWNSSYALNNGADADGDDDSDGGDFLAWQLQEDSGVSLTSAQAVPEPTTLLLLIAAITCLPAMLRKDLSLEVK